MEQQTRQQRRLVDVVGASVVALLVVGFAFLFVSVFGLTGGRYMLVAAVGVPAFILWALWQLVGSETKVSWHCPSCNSTK